MALVLSLILLGLALRDVQPARVLSIVAAVNGRFLALALLLDAGVFLLKALKWQCVFAPVRRLPLSSFFSAIAVGSAANAVLPFRLDEVVRTFYLASRVGVAKATVLGTLVLERLLDASCLLLALVALVALFGRAEWLAGATLTLVAILALAGVVVAIFWLRPRLLLDGMAPGLEALKHPARAMGALLFGVGEWLVAVLYMRAVLLAFGLDLGLGGELALVAAGYLSFALPGAPAALGAFELLVKGTLATGLAVDPDTAMSCALTLHFLLVVPIASVGAAVLVRDGLSPWRLRDLAVGTEAE